MNKAELLKRLLPGLLPLIVFIIADEVWGTIIGLIIAVAFGIVQLAWFFFREKRLDRFTLFDTLLLILLGGVSILLDNDIFFKLKPGLIGIIFCIILGLSAFSRFNIMGMMTKRYMQDIPVNEEQVKQFSHSIKILFLIFSVHTLLVFYAAFFMSKDAWAFISTALFYILFGAYFLIEFIRARYRVWQMKKEEWLPVVDDDGKITGKAPRRICHSNKNLIHPVIHLHLLDKKRIYLQKRSPGKLVQPGKWDTAVGGHISINETLENALMREAHEELGISGFTPKLLVRYKWESEIETEMVFLFITEAPQIITPNLSEMTEGRFWTLQEIKENLGKGVFTPNFEIEFGILQKQFFK